MAAQKKVNVLLLGGGAVGTIAALNIESGGLGNVTAVLRSNYAAVKENGYTIRSIDHGNFEGWRPSQVLPSIPNVVEANLPPFDYILLVTKNCPDIPPSIATLIAPAVTPGTTKLVMIQNGINIEKPLFKAFPKNIVLSGVSMIDAHEKESGTIFHEYHDLLYIGAFHNTSPTAHHSKEIEDEAAREFIEIYNAAGKSTVEFNEDVQWARWRKLVFNATFNPLCAITGLDDGKLRLTDGAVEGLLRPAMNEVVATAKALGYQLPEDVIETMIHCDEIDLYLKPSMQIDSEKGNFLEFENLVGEPLREAEKIGVPTPTLKIIYELCKALQWKTKVGRGLVSIPPKKML